MKERIERLSRYLEYKGINDNQATVICGLSKGLIGKARAGKADIGQAACKKILEKFQDLSKVWLLTGEGEMLKQSQVSDNVVPCGDNGTALQRVGLPELTLENAILKEKIATLEKRDGQMSELYYKLDRMRERLWLIIFVGTVFLATAVLLMMIPLVIEFVKEVLQ